MTFKPKHINTIRGVTQWVMRGVAVLLIAVGLYLCLKRVFFGVGVGRPRDAFTVFREIGETHSFYRGAAMLVVGGLLAALAPRLSRWVVAVPPETCPRCGQPRAPGGGTRCPECGLDGFDPEA